MNKRQRKKFRSTGSLKRGRDVRPTVKALLKTIEAVRTMTFDESWKLYGLN